MTLVSTGIGVAALIALTTVLVFALRLEHPWLQPWAILRAAVQLGLLSLILVGVITSPWWVALFLAAMVLVTNSRLSVQPVTEAEWRQVCALGATDPD